MRADWTNLERFRWVVPKYSPFHSAPGERFGRFIIGNIHGTPVSLVVIATEGDPSNEAEIGEAGRWEHVSVSAVLHARKPNQRERIPTWEEMCLVKDLFWTPEECVMQLHPPASDHININHFVLHLWRPLDVAIPMPPKECV